MITDSQQRLGWRAFTASEGPPSAEKASVYESQAIRMVWVLLKTKTIHD